MSGHKAGPELERLMALLARVPGLGPRSARRAALTLLRRRESLMVPLAEALVSAAAKINACSVCGNWDSIDPCTICRDPQRDGGLICVVQEVGDLWAFERTRAHPGLYHVLGGVLSPLDGVGPEDLNIASLAQRASAAGVREIILATSATIDGQTTASYVAERLEGFGVPISRLSHGVPMGGELGQLDDGTLSAALRARRPF